ncbi:hypothetical protein CFC21_102661 [Triticum aestivum]|uniref:Uncharacterized protein n=3 Tax=Triticum TaxID=4564 RepID=A0A9R1BZD0_TRITD|nr:uncharacterized protein LOC119335949 [Triticum dicoccoides]XP_044435447.1 uncharacterized protein LOC123161705 [Triticum aestivum]KAF7101287.1 hypothetical protein CFC21_102661 [Triticum aestivum]VAI86637.1 unnamed protein product [Triticum turgidum subsp. durum]
MKAKTKIRKAADFLRKAVRALRGRAGVLRARLLFLASLRHRTAMVGTVSRHLRALMPGRQRDPVHDHRKALALSTMAAEEDGQAAKHGVDVPGLSGLLQEVVGDDDDGHCGYPDWTHSLFDDDDDDCNLQEGDDVDEERGGGAEAMEEDQLPDDEPSVMDVIRRCREGDGMEFNIEEEIDHAADMFIRRVRSRMSNRSF